ncbi:DUF3150 domain-containing protein, partial [Desulfobotulus mexicanus]
DVNIWTARRKLTPSDFKAVDLPPEKIASLGSKRICDPAELRIFSTLKGRAVALLDSVGVRFLGGWAIPEHLVAEMQRSLMDLRDDFMQAREDFLGSYDESVQAWIKDNPGWESIIAGSVVDADYARSRLGFSWQMFRVVAPKSDVLAGGVDAGLDEELDTLGSRLFGDIAKTADIAWERSYAGKSEVSQKALSPLRYIHKKLSGLSFVEPRVTPVLSLVDTALSKIPGTGSIDGADLLMLQGLLCILRNPDTLVDHGQKILDGRTPDTILDGLLKAPSGVSCPSVPNDFMEDVESAEPIDIEEYESAVQVPDRQPEPVLNSFGLW